ncbi:MAG: EAL domain-containing protein [Treponema sp.]|nr:EAL domain-containing protein [Treponema sp.]
MEYFLDNSNQIKQLQRALFYETQFRNAIVSDSLCFFDFNVTRDLIENDFFRRTSRSNEVLSVPESIGLSVPCSFSVFVKTWVKKMIPDVSRRNKEDYSDLRDVLLNAYEQGKRDYTIDFWIDNYEGQKVFINQRFLLNKNEKNEICALAVTKDNTENVTNSEQNYRDKIEQYAYYDQITQGYNYFKFKETIHNQNLIGRIISMDIHSFKVINSICGINKGDIVIKKIWDCIVDDVNFDSGELAAHVFADHFVIFMPYCDNEIIIQHIKNITNALITISSELDVPQLEPYFGISVWEPGKKVELSYSEAVSAKHKARVQQKENYSFFEEKDTLRLVEEKRLSDSFEGAIINEEFKIWFQPKYNPFTQKMVGAEALVRWIPDENTIIPPGTFIPLFERNGMIRVLDEYIFKKVCIQQKDWQNQGKEIIPISINLSRASLYFKDVVDHYKKITQDIGLDTKYVPIEITETAAISMDDIKEIADNFYKAGFALHMDDFGSGYSSLASLNLMHFDTLKLDKSLIDFIGNFGGNRLIEHTISLARELGIHVTAEGVENESQASFLNNIGCDSIQGYYYSKPVPLDVFEKMIDISTMLPPQISMDYPTRHINIFKQNLFKPYIYDFIANLSKNTFHISDKKSTWYTETNIITDEYDEHVIKVAEKLMFPEYKDSYLDFMNREKLLSHFCGMEETKVFNYIRMFNDKPTHMRLVIHIFLDIEKTDVMMYGSITPLS